MDGKTIEAIPQYVIEALMDVRTSGRVNMFNRSVVTQLAGVYGDPEAYDWLTDNPDRYMEALNEMGNYIANSDG